MQVDPPTEPRPSAAVDPPARRADRLRARLSAGSAGAGALLSFLVAAALFSRYGTDAHLWRDEAIYAYGGQQFAEGVPFYASIFDIKTPLASQIAGIGVLAGRAIGVDDLEAIRIVFFLCACGTVAAVYLLGRWLWRSPLAGIVAAAVFVSFRGFAMDAAGGPNAKTPGILFAVASMALVVRGRWFWASFVGALGFLVWQPLVIYPVLVAVAAVLTASPGRRRSALGHSLAGAAVPVAVTVVYFLLSGALPKFVEAAFVFPVTGLERGHSTLSGRITDITTTLRASYGVSRFLFWGGLIALPALLAARLIRGRADLRNTIADPFVCVVIPSLAVISVYSMIDFQGYPDLYPGLPYAAIGVAGAAAFVVELLSAPALRRAATAGALIVAAALVALSWRGYTHAGATDHLLKTQQAHAAEIERILDPGEKLWALGDPTPLVLTGRRNPSRFIYLSSGVGRWARLHTPGGFTGWVRSIQAVDPAVIVLHDWGSGLGERTNRWLEPRYDHGYLGTWKVFLRPGVSERARRRGVVLRDPVPATL